MAEASLSRRDRVDRFVRILGAVLTTLCAVPLVVLIIHVFDARFSAPANDPHGYRVVFSSLFAIALCLPTSLFLPLIFPAGRRGWPLLLSVVIFLMVGIALFILLITAD